MPRFVILEHDHPFLHWDLMLQTGEVLRTWRLLEQPHLGKTIAAEALGDHRLMYLDYEGPVSGGRGVVQRFDTGAYEGKLPDSPSAGKEATIDLRGQHIKGKAVLCYQNEGKWTVRFIRYSGTETCR